MSRQFDVSSPKRNSEGFFRSDRPAYQGLPYANLNR